MVDPLKVAERTMTEYYASRREVWPSIEARGILHKVRLGKDHRWTERELVSHSAAILDRALFSVDDVIQNHLGIALTRQSLEYLDPVEGCRVYGCAYPGLRMILICTRTLDYLPLYRTTAIHELGHVLMHRGCANRCLLFKPQRPGSTPEDREANAFMQAVILPDAILHLGTHYICHLYRIDPRLAYEGANTDRGRWIWKKRLFGPLINLLCVSRQMIGIKMKERRVFTQETAEYHKTYALATRWHTPKPGGILARSLEKVLGKMSQGSPCPGS